jgi:hypothetical protein
VQHSVAAPCSLTQKLFRPKQFSICPRRKQWLDRLLADIEAHYDLLKSCSGHIAIRRHIHGDPRPTGKC